MLRPWLEFLVVVYPCWVLQWDVRFGIRMSRQFILEATLSDYVNKNKKQSYDNLPPKYKFDGDFNVVQSYYPYQYKLKLDEDIQFDQTYEEKNGIGWSRISNHLRKYCFGMSVSKNMT